MESSKKNQISTDKTMFFLTFDSFLNVNTFAGYFFIIYFWFVVCVFVVVLAKFFNEVTKKDVSFQHHPDTVMEVAY